MRDSGDLDPAITRRVDDRVWEPGDLALAYLAEYDRRRLRVLGHLQHRAFDLVQELSAEPGALQIVEVSRLARSLQTTAMRACDPSLLSGPWFVRLTRLFGQSP